MTEDQVALVRAAMQRQLVHAVLSNDQVARDHGLLVTDLQVLHLLVLRDDVRTPRQISAVTGTPASTVTKLIDRLETAGYVRRTSDPADRRRTVLELVSEAIAPLHALYGRSGEQFDAMSRQFTSAELEIITRYLDVVTDFYAIDGMRDANSEIQI